MLEIFGKVFGTDKAIDNLLDKDTGLLAKAGAWVGNLNYTAEEKAEANARTRDWALTQLGALAPFKVVQRILAFAVASMWLVVGLNVVAAVWINAVWGIDARTDLLAFAMSDYVFWPVMSVLSLYFTGGVIESRTRTK